MTRPRPRRAAQKTQPAGAIPFIVWSSALRETTPMRVLVVEDDVRMANVIRRSLTKEGLATDVANEGKRAIAMATAVDYDAIVLDVMLPDTSGFEACKALRERGIWSPVVMLTAREAVED